MSKLQLVVAGAPELVRSNQKDRFYTNYINSLLSDISRQNLPIRLWLKWQREFQLLAELTYYGLTTIFGNQTLGEEYCHAIQVGPVQQQKYVAAGFLRRNLPVLVQIIGPYAIERMLETLYQKIRDRNIPLTLNEQQYTQLENVVSFLEDLFNVCSRLHLALFYIQGLFYHFGKRITGIRYLMLRYGLDGTQQSQTSTYRILGWLILLQLSVKFFRWLWAVFKKKQRMEPSEISVGAFSNPEDGAQFKVVGESSHQQYGSSIKCPLCLELCKVQTASPCGHIFCWECIAECTSEKPECPICRSEVEPQQLIALQHFDV